MKKTTRDARRDVRAAERRGSSTCRTRSTGAGCARTRSGCSRRSASSSWQDAGAVDRTEWVAQIRTVTTLVRPYQLQEASHASYWGQLAMRNCLGRPTTTARSRRQVRRAADGLDAFREPNMTLAPL